MRTLARVLVALLALTACGRVESRADLAAQATTSEPAITSTPAVLLTQTYTCTDPQYGYTIALPADWQVVEDTPCSPRFRGPDNPTPGSLPFNSDELYAGGVSVLGPLQTEGPEAALGWRQMLHNHTTERAMTPIETPVGPARVFSLERDREPESQQDGARVWWAQHTAIPAGPFSYDIWVQVGPDDLGPPVPVLAAMLQSFTRTTGEAPLPASPAIDATSTELAVTPPPTTSSTTTAAPARPLVDPALPPAIAGKGGYDYQ